MKISEIIDKHSDVDYTIDTLAGIDSKKVATLYKLVLTISDNRRLNSQDALSPDDKFDLVEAVNEAGKGAIVGSTSYKMIKEIQQWLNE